MVLIWLNEKIQIKDLKEFSDNPRKISKKDFDRLVNDIKQDGYHRRIMLSHDNHIIGGHSRKKALLKAGYKLSDEIEVIKPSRELTETEFKRLNVRDNLYFGEFDMDILANKFDPFELSDWGLTIPEVEIGDLNEEMSETIKVDTTGETITKLGDLWILDNHRLMCGDATNLSDINILTQDAKIDFIYTDPPYGIDIKMNVALKGKAKNKVYDPIIGDKTTQTAKDTFFLITTMFNTPIVYWGANYFTDFLPPSKCWIVWDKRGDNLPDNNFCGTELAYTNASKHSKTIVAQWFGIIREGESEKSGNIHPTQKPVKLALEIFKYLDAGKNVLELFAGSGSTLIACEKSKRNCYAMELSPFYCDSIIQRWEKLTNKKAILSKKNYDKQN